MLPGCRQTWHCSGWTTSAFRAVMTLLPHCCCALPTGLTGMVGGQWRVVDGQIPGMDVAGLIAEHSAAARRLVNG